MTGLWERISGALGWVDPDEYEDEFEAYELMPEEMEDDAWEHFDPREVEETDETTTERRNPGHLGSRHRVVSLPGGSSGQPVRVAVAKPTGFDSVQEIADKLKKRVGVVVNVEQIDRSVARRIIDFLSGTVYSLDGQMQQVSAGVVIFVPRDMRIEVMRSEAEGRMSRETEEGERLEF